MIIIDALAVIIIEKLTERGINARMSLVDYYYVSISVNLVTTNCVITIRDSYWTITLEPLSKRCLAVGTFKLDDPDSINNATNEIIKYLNNPERIYMGFYGFDKRGDNDNL